MVAGAESTASTASTGPSPGRFDVGTSDGATAPLSDVRVGFRSAYVFELQDLRQPTPIAVHVLALNPRRYTLSEPFQSTLTPTEANTVVAEENGLIIRELTLEGTLGLSTKRGPAFGGDQGVLSGNEHFMHLRNLFRRYSRLKKRPQDSAHVRMVFHSLKDDDHFVVVPRTFDSPRDARTTRMHYDYLINLAVIADADNSLTPLELDEGFDFFAGELAAVAGFFNDARAAFAEVTAQLDTVRRKVANIQSVLIQAAGFINAVGNAFQAAENLIVYPLQLAASTLEAVDNAADVLAEAATTPDSIEFRMVRELRRMSTALDKIKANSSLFGPSPLVGAARAYDGERRLTAADLAANAA
jgi:hypothetical protein